MLYGVGMSVTFTLLIPTAAYPDGVLGERCDCREVLKAQDHQCEDFVVYQSCDHVYEMCQHNLLDVNVSNANAGDLLRRMGYVVDPYGPSGRADADEFLRRAMRLANGQDMALDTVETGGPGTGEARMIDCGRSDDYHVRVGTAFMALAKAAQDRDCRVGWC